MTNNHVVTGAALLQVYVGGETDRVYSARVLGVSECSDLAVIYIEGDGFPFLQWYEDEIDVGLDVYAAGFPLGDPEYTLTKGIISKARTSGETDWASVDAVVEHDATINPGNSGGPPRHRRRPRRGRQLRRRLRDQSVLRHRPHRSAQDH